ncbi:MAG: TM2 domain-containing protein [Spirochaetaceae bacterium]|jgi:TM2 domain-containing membrane protein YozV|nr:TM2 domain-containing protein [Spirochaetaceae bacterium]
MYLEQQVNLLQEKYGYDGDKCGCPQHKAVVGYCTFCGAPVCDECHDGAYCRLCVGDPPKKKSTVLLLAVLLGWLGVHRFYMKFYVTGVIYMCTLGLFGVGWAIDVIRILFFSTVNYKERKYSLVGDIAGAFSDSFMDNASSNTVWILERRFWRDRYGRPLLPLGWKSLGTEEKVETDDKDAGETAKSQQ